MTDIETALRARIEEWNAHILGPGLTQWGIDDLAFTLAALAQGMGEEKDLRLSKIALWFGMVKADAVMRDDTHDIALAHIQEALNGITDDAILEAVSDHVLCHEKQDTLHATLAEQEKQLIARQIWIDKYAKQTEVALRQRDEASDAVAEQAREIERLTTILTDVTADANLSHQQIPRLEEEIERLREAHPEEAVRRFHEALDVPLGGSWPKAERRLLRMRLIDEEFQEYISAERADDAVGVLDALVDMVYVIVGAALEYGMDFPGAFAAVQAANMAKLGPDGKPIVRHDGKILKPEGWKAADLTPFLAALRATPEARG